MPTSIQKGKYEISHNARGSSRIESVGRVYVNGLIGFFLLLASAGQLAAQELYLFRPSIGLSHDDPVQIEGKIIDASVEYDSILIKPKWPHSPGVEIDAMSTSLVDQAGVALVSKGGLYLYPVDNQDHLYRSRNIYARRFDFENRGWEPPAIHYYSIADGGARSFYGPMSRIEAFIGGSAMEGFVVSSSAVRVFEGSLVEEVKYEVLSSCMAATDHVLFYSCVPELDTDDPGITGFYSSHWFDEEVLGSVEDSLSALVPELYDYIVVASLALPYRIASPTSVSFVGGIGRISLHTEQGLYSTLNHEVTHSLYPHGEVPFLDYWNHPEFAMFPSTGYGSGYAGIEYVVSDSALGLVQATPRAYEIGMGAFNQFERWQLGLIPGDSLQSYNYFGGAHRDSTVLVRQSDGSAQYVDYYSAATLGTWSVQQQSSVSRPGTQCESASCDKFIPIVITSRNRLSPSEMGAYENLFAGYFSNQITVDYSQNNRGYLNLGLSYFEATYGVQRAVPLGRSLALSTQDQAWSGRTLPQKRDLLSIYPTPVSDYLNVEVQPGLGSNGRLLIYNVAGQIVARSQLTETSGIIDVRSLASGAYYLMLRTDTSLITKPFVVAR